MQIKWLYCLYSVIVIVFILIGAVLDIDLNTAIYGTVILYTALLYLLYKAEGYFSLTLLFSITYGVFLFGRHLAYIFAGGDLDVFTVGFLSDSVLNERQFNYWTAIELASLTIFTLMAVSVKIKFGTDYSYGKEKYKYTNSRTPLMLVILISIVVGSTFLVFIELLEYVVRYGYVGIYIYNSNMAENATIISKIYYYSGALVYILFGYSYVYRKSKKETYLLVSLIVIKSFLFLMIGQRGPFICTMLFLVLMNSKDKRNNIFKMTFLFIGLAILSQAINFLRGTGQEISSVFNALSRFFYEQGISFYIPYLTSLYEFPTLAKFQTLLPGSKYIYELFTGINLSLQDYNFGYALTFNENARAISEGAGFGWSILSDFQQIFSGDVGILFGMGFLGAILGFLESKRSSEHCKFILYSIVIPFLFLPRASIASITPILVICFSIIFIRISIVKTKCEIISEC